MTYKHIKERHANEIENIERTKQMELEEDHERNVRQQRELKTDVTVL